MIVRGISGRQGRSHARLMRAFGTNIVAGVSRTPGEVEGVPVYPDVASAIAATGAVASVVMVPAAEARAAVEEGIAAGLRLIVCVTEGIPVHDALAMVRAARAARVILIGGSTPDFVIPGRAKLGFLPDVALAPGPLGIMSKSGTLPYEVCYRLVKRGFGQTLWMGVGGDPVKGLRLADLVPWYAGNAATRALVVLGEIGGSEEEELAEALTANRFTKPVFVLLAGASAPEGVTMGHAGAMIEGARGTIASKRAALEAAGAQVFTATGALIEAVAAKLGG